VSLLRRLLLALLVLFPLSAQAAELTLHVFDVGQGDAMLLVSPAGKTVLIDAGPPDAADKLAARLKELVHGPIDLMLMTHPHAAEKRILATGEEIGSDVYKVAHHASRHSSSAELLAKIHPRIAVVSVGANNEYGHPTRETLDRLEAVKAEVLRTDLDGEIVLKSDGEHVTYTTEKSDVLVTVAPTDDKGTQPATHPSKVATATHKNGATDKPHDTVAKKPVPDEVVVDTSAHKATAVATTSGYVASKNSQVFHKPGCNNVARIKPDNILHFATRDEAVASGRRPAKDCNP
jgi:hypothetical protein